MLHTAPTYTCSTNGKTIEQQEDFRKYKVCVGFKCCSLTKLDDERKRAIVT